MTHKQTVLALEPRACIEKTDGVWTVRKYADGPVIGTNRYEVQAWQSARMRLFSESIGNILSEIPVAQK